MSEIEAPKTEVKKEKKIPHWGPYHELKGIAVQKAHVHQGTPVPGCSVETTLQTTESNPQSKTRGIEMKFTALGLACRIPWRARNTIEFFMVPLANVIVAYSTYED